MSLFLCYDLKGIQQYIFQIPKLKCCIGGSRQIDSFDREEAAEIAKSFDGVSRIYSGGGKGAFECASEQSLAGLKDELIDRARLKGLTIRFGISEDYLTAAREISETYCYQPDSLEGPPCSVSGLYPVLGKVHPLIRKRLELGGEHGEESPVEGEFLKALRTEFRNPELSFFYNVESRDEEGREGARALGRRNRWAVVCMDGNDMGSQFLAFARSVSADPGEARKQWSAWLPEMSKSLDECTRAAATAGMIEVARQYLGRKEHSGTLPLRPLIVGGDDVTILVHCSYALLFCRTVMAKFNEYSRKFAHLWRGTGGELTISAGILYAPVTLPLHSALNFTEMLLASAKTRGRDLRGKNENCASPACLDWESVTEGLLVSPNIRRQREFIFSDEENGMQVELTSRPYSLDELDQLEKEMPLWEKLPRNIQYQFHPALLAPKDKRFAFYARLRKNYPEQAAALQEPLEKVIDSYGSAWQVRGSVMKTRVLDILLLKQEETRLQKPTIPDEEE